MGNHLCACFGAEARSVEKIQLHHDARPPKLLASGKAPNATLDQVTEALAAEDVNPYGPGAGGVLSPSPELQANEKVLRPEVTSGAAAQLGEIKTWLEQAKLTSAQPNASGALNNGSGGGNIDSVALESITQSTPQTSAHADGGVDVERRPSGDDAALQALLQRVDEACARLTATPASASTNSSANTNNNTSAAATAAQPAQAKGEEVSAALPPPSSLFAEGSDAPDTPRRKQKWVATRADWKLSPPKDRGSPAVFSSPARSQTARELADSSPQPRSSSPASSTRSGSSNTPRKKFNLV
mmetsp:Transcript_48116/g.113545  ORF Transcript_48116/g.113545 Transcript_48116/m.113545 type:complete len:299 (+) Transcript_48116:100-996(+)